MNYARSIVKRLYPHINKSSLFYQELESAAMLGLVDAANKYNDDKDNKHWKHYCYFRVSGSVRDIMRTEIEQGYIGLTNRGRNSNHTPVILEDTADLIMDEGLNPEELCIMHECWELALDYIMTCREDTAVKMVAAILYGASSKDIENSGGFTRVGELINYHKPLMLRYIRERMGIAMDTGMDMDAEEMEEQ
jgi:hypothetical protein